MPSPDFTPNRTIQMALRSGTPLDVQAEVTGQWAVHVTWGKTKLREPYTVTHVLTGCSVVKDVTLEDARDLARQLAERVPPFETAAGADWLRAAAVMREIVKK